MIETGATLFIATVFALVFAFMFEDAMQIIMEGEKDEEIIDCDAIKHKSYASNDSNSQ